MCKTKSRPESFNNVDINIPFMMEFRASIFEHSLSTDVNKNQDISHSKYTWIKGLFERSDKCTCPI